MTILNHFQNNANIIDVDKYGIGEHKGNWSWLSFCCGFTEVADPLDTDNTCCKATAANILASLGYNPRKYYPTKVNNIQHGRNSIETNAYDIYEILINQDFAHMI